MKRFLILILLISSINKSVAQFFKNDKNIQKFEGYFTFYYDDSKDKIYLEVTQLETEFLYVNSLSEGIGSNDIGLDRGQLGGQRIVKFIKAGNKLLLVQPNQDYRAITENAEEKKAVEQALPNQFYMDLRSKKNIKTPT